MTDCLPRLELIRRESMGALGDYEQHLKGCPRCERAVGSLIEARRELLGDSPDQHALASTRAARRILDEVAERKTRSRWGWRYLLPVGLAPVVATMAFVVGTGGLASHVDGDRAASVFAQAPSTDGARAKGALMIDVFCKRGDSVFQVNEGADFFSGDRLRFSYTKARSGFLAVFGVDDAGRVFPYYQDATLSSMSVEAGSKAMLPGSVELDNHKGWERVYALWSPRPLDEQSVRGAVDAAMTGADIRLVSRLPLPTTIDQVSYLLRRP